MNADRVSELRGINDLIFAAKERQRIGDIKEVSKRSKGNDETDEEEKGSPEHGGEATDTSNVSSSMSTNTEVPTAARSLAKQVGSVPRLASRPAAFSVVDSFMGPDDAGPTGYRSRPSDDVKANSVLPSFLPPEAYSVAVPRTVVPITVPSPVVLTTALQVTRLSVPMRLPAPTVSTLSASGPVPAPVIQPVP